MTPLAPQLRARLHRVLAEGPALRLAVLFGSQASGKSRPGSDFDIGILPASSDLSLHDELLLGSELSSVTGTEVDIVRLDGAVPLLGAEVARSGICLFEETPGTFAAFRATAISEWMDFEDLIAPHRARFLQRLAKGGA